MLQSVVSSKHKNILLNTPNTAAPILLLSTPQTSHLISKENQPHIIQRRTKRLALGCEKFPLAPALLLLSRSGPPFSPSLYFINMPQTESVIVPHAITLPRMPLLIAKSITLRWESCLQRERNQSEQSCFYPFPGKRITFLPVQT